MKIEKYDYPSLDEMRAFNLSQEEWFAELQDYLYHHMDDELDPDQQKYVDNMSYLSRYSWSIYSE